MSASGLFALLTAMLVGTFSASLYWAGAPRASGAKRVQSWLMVLAVPLAVGLLYAMLGEPRALKAAASTQHAADTTMAEATRKLAERLQREPGDLDGWLMLARSYNALERHGDAAAAYEHAAPRAMESAPILTEWVETRLLAAERRFDARTYALVDHAKAIAPDDPDVLSLYALAAIERGDAKSATTALFALQKHYPPGTPDRDGIDSALAKLARGEDPRGGPLRTPAR